MQAALKLLAPHRSGIVYASAGTGKTWLLLSRMLRLLLDDTLPGSILAITFTNKAAAEMHDKVAARILEWNTQTASELANSLREIGIDDSQRYRERARRLYEKLLHTNEPPQITTFHAFCQKLVAMGALHSKVPADFQVIENAEQWQEQALDLLFRTTTPEEQRIAEALATLYAKTRSVNNVRTVLKNFLTRQNDWLNYVSGIPDAAAARLHAQLGIDEMPSSTQIWEGIRDELAAYSELLGMHKNKKNIEYAESLRKINALDKLSDADFAELNRCIHTQSGEPRQRKQTQVLLKLLGETGVERLIDLCYKISANVKLMQEYTNRVENHRLNRAWYIAGSHLLKIYTVLKQQHKVLDFDDLERIASTLLNQEDYGSQWLQYRLAARIEHILIDEFQDTNPTQWQLLQPLMAEIASQNGGSVFIVGDCKQSIYGFRRADPQLQAHAGAWLKHHLAGTEASADISYRSAAPIIDCVNTIFSNHPNLLDFKHHETQRDIKGGVYIFDLFAPVAEDETNAADEWRNSLQQPLPTPPHTHSSEAAAIAKTIARLCERRLEIVAADRSRPIEYRDILILARQKTHFDLFTKALRRLRIPVNSTHRAGLLSCLEITDMLQLLAVLHNPYDDLALAQVLRSPIYALSDCHLSELGHQEGEHYFSKLRNLAAHGGALWRGVYDSLRSWSAWCARLPIHDMLYTIYEQQNLISRYRASVHPEQRDQIQLNLETFLEYTLDYDSGRYPDIARFLDHTTLVRQTHGDTAVTPTDHNCVRLMSIHAAKGLEAPVVFMIDCAFVLPQKETHNILVDWPADDRTPKHFVLMPPLAERSALLTELSNARFHRDKKEEMNLLYVALTRAKQYLFISGSGKPDTKRGHWYNLITSACGEKRTFGEDPLQQGAASRPLTAVSQSEASIDLRQWTDSVSLPPSVQQIEPSQLGYSGRASAATPSTAARLRGVLIHRAIVLLGKQKYRDCESFKQFLKGDSTAPRELLDACAEEAWALVHKPELNALFSTEDHLNTYYEMPLLYTDPEGRLVYGRVDQVCVLADRVWVVDYKSGSPSAHQSEPEKYYQESASVYWPQMRCYRDGVAKLFPHRPIQVSLLFTRSGFLYHYPSSDTSI